MTPNDFEFIRTYLKERSGLSLSDDKQYLLETRLMPVMREAGYATLTDLIAAVRQQPSAPLANAVVEAMTTNESLFFRDKVPFEQFRQAIMPALLASRAAEKRIRIWCAAASTGQEPYSLAMILREMKQPQADWRIEILATDLSNSVLDRAREGVYSQFEVQRGLPVQMLLKYFTQIGERWQISPDIRAAVKFQRTNLLDNFAALGTFDVVFCRNVLIYFDKDTKLGVLDRLARQIAPDGYLVLGGAETVVGVTGAFVPHPEHRGLNQPAGRGRIAAFPASPPLAPGSAGQPAPVTPMYKAV